MPTSARPPRGSPPGTLVIPEWAPKPRIRVMEYSTDTVQERDIADPAELRAYLEPGAVSWIDVQGMGDEAVLRQLAEIFELHPLALEDIVQASERPKVEQYDKQLLIIAREVGSGAKGRLQTDQMSILVGANYVLTFQQRYGDSLDPVRQRIRHSGTAIRKMGSDYLAYTILDAILDSYYPILERFGETVQELEDQIVARPSPRRARQIYAVRRDLLSLRRAIWPQRDAVNTLIRDPWRFLSDPVRVYLRDCYDHIVQLMDEVETLHELSAGLMDAHLAAMSNRLNEVMKVLTIIATIFMPLSFLAGVYGMNFDTAASPWNMPELSWRYGYVAFWTVILAVGGTMLYYFRRRHWL